MTVDHLPVSGASAVKWGLNPEKFFSFILSTFAHNSFNHNRLEMVRTATIKRDTNETKVHVILSLDGGDLDDLPSETSRLNGERTNKHAFQNSKAQYIDIDTGVGFLDHMVHQLAKHGGWSLYLRTRGDLHSMTCSLRLSPSKQGEHTNWKSS
jgi:hypothetical protein